MSNPNNCSTCEWKAHDDKGHCYMFFDAPEEVCMQHTGRQKVGFINHIPCKGSLSLLAVLVANTANLEPISEGKPWFKRMGIDEALFRDAVDDVEAEHFENETQTNLNMALDQLGGVRIVYEADFKEEYPDVVKK